MKQHRIDTLYFNELHPVMQISTHQGDHIISVGSLKSNSDGPLGDCKIPTNVHPRHPVSSIYMYRYPPPPLQFQQYVSFYSPKPEASLSNSKSFNISRVSCKIGSASSLDNTVSIARDIFLSTRSILKSENAKINTCLCNTMPLFPPFKSPTPSLPTETSVCYGLPTGQVSSLYLVTLLIMN